MKTIQKLPQACVCAMILISLISLNSYAQEIIEVKITQAQMSKGSQSCYVVEIPQAEPKTVQQNWIKKLQEGTKIKVKEINQEFVLAGVLKTEFSTDTVNIYSMLFQKDSTISLYVFVEFDSVFFKPNDDKTDLTSAKKDNSITNYIRSFAVDQYKLAVTAELEDQQKILKTLQKDLEKLEKDEENMIKENSSLENDIDKTEREIKDIEAAIDLENKGILSHITSMQNIVSEADKKAAQERQKDLEKEKNKLEKDRSKAKNDISSYKSKIEKNKKDIKEGEKLQEEKNEEITIQTELVSKVQAKLGGIK
jgi:DNA repair exonuclease SbcCD ATPase subunit